jgi:RNA polymerase sigma-70 factor (ECF subfamily)
MSGLSIELKCQDSDEVLLARMQRGEHDACTCFVKRFAPLVYTQALRLVNDADEAEGILQESFIKACERILTFEGRSAIGTWLYRIATNQALMHLRRRRPTASLTEADEAIQPGDLPHNLSRWAVDPEKEILNTELQQHLETALAALPESLRTVFVLREMQGQSTADTAAELGLSESAVKVRLHRARLRLRETLAAYLSPEEMTP